MAVSSRSRACTPADDSTSMTAEIARCAAVPTPVATTIARACPATIVLPSNSMLARSVSVARDRVHLLVDRQRLPGEQGFVDLEVFGHQQTRVGGHHVRGRQVDDVAGTQRAR